jgi:hypothetical protein
MILKQQYSIEENNNFKDTKGMSLSVKRSSSWYLSIGDLASGGTV